MRHSTWAHWLVAGAVTAGLIATTAGTASAHVPVIPILIQKAVTTTLAPSLRRPLILALPADLVPTLEHHRILPTHAAADEDDESGMFFGPVFIRPDHAGSIRKMTKSMPDPLKKLVLGSVGPWAMSGQPLGNSVSAGPAIYARF